MPNRDGGPCASTGYNCHSEKAFDLHATQRDCGRLGCVAFTRSGKWAWFHHSIVADAPRWKRTSGTTLWVNHAAAMPAALCHKLHSNRIAPYDAPGSVPYTALAPCGCSRHRCSCHGYMNHTSTAQCMLHCSDEGENCRGDVADTEATWNPPPHTSRRPATGAAQWEALAR